jgi:hypothetical protein
MFVGRRPGNWGELWYESLEGATEAKTKAAAE